MVVVLIVLGTVLYCLIMIGVVSDMAAHCVYIGCVILESAWTMMTIHPTGPTAACVVSTWTGHQAPRAYCMCKYNMQLWHTVH